MFLFVYLIKSRIIMLQVVYGICHFFVHFKKKSQNHNKKTINIDGDDHFTLMSFFSKVITEIRSRISFSKKDP